MSDALRADVDGELSGADGSRLVAVLGWLDIATSSWYRKAKRVEGRKPKGRRKSPVPRDVAEAVKEMAEGFPWYGYKRIAVMCRRAQIPKWQGWAKGAKERLDKLMAEAS